MLLKTSSLRQRLVWIILFISGSCVLITTAAITALGYVSLQDKMESNLSHSTAIRGDALTALINYGSQDDIEARLKPSRSDAEIIACVYNTNIVGDPDIVFAQFPRKEVTKSSCPETQEIASRSYDLVVKENGRLKSYHPIYSKAPEENAAKLPLGYIYVETNLNEIDQFIRSQVLIAFLIMLAVFAMSYLMAQRLQRSISQPILKLVNTTRRVSYERDYSIRADNFLEGEDIKRNEISVLIEAFNQMLNEVEERRKLLLRKNQELVKAKEIAESANRAKSQFLANISHELRTPLNAVIGFSDLIRNQILGPINDMRYVDYARDINESGEHLLHIINDILDLSKAEAGKLEPVLREVSVKKTLSECITYISKRAEDNNIKIETEIPEKMPPLVVDRVMFKRIVANLLSNSVKFTNRGGTIKVSASVKLSNRRENIFTITIEDTGIGMTKEDIDLAFKSFVQLDSGLNRKYEGTGLGLPLTKKLIELHGGSIELLSKVGEGTKAIIKFYTPNNES